MKAERLVTRQQPIDEFLEESEKDFRRMATYILKRWKAPNDVGIEDVMQELRLAAWTAKKKYDARRGVAPERYISFQAINYAKRRVHRARRARDDRSTGNFEALTDTGVVEDWSAEPATQESELARRDELKQLIDACLLTSDAICLAAFFSEEDTAAAARRIFENEDLRRLCRVGSMLDAERAVKRTVKEHACRQQHNG